MNTLATLVVDALELGGGKAERDVADELFAAFGVDLGAIDASVGEATSDRKATFRKAAAEALAAGARSPEALINETVRCGGGLHRDGGGDLTARSPATPRRRRDLRSSSASNATAWIWS